MWVIIQSVKEQFEMDKTDFEKSLDVIIQALAIRINEVYHLDKSNAVRKLRSTSLFSMIENEETKLWQRDIESLFALYQDEIETGHFTI